MLGPLDLIVPPVVLLTSLATLPFTLLILPLTSDLNAFSSWLSFRHAWFKHFWFWFGPASKPLFSPGVTPILAETYGIVLDIGPASGVWMQELGKAARSAPGRIEKIYGIEPNTLFHPQLLSAARKAGLEGVYEPLAVYAENLEGRGIKKGSVDTIITVHVLCSVGPQAVQEKIAKELYEYLKPGGQWLVFEHVASQHAPIRAWQNINNIVWTTLLDGCSLDRNTGDILKNAGEWESIDIGPDPREGYFESLPHTVGKLIKKR